VLSVIVAVFCANREPVISSSVKLFVGNLPFAATSRTLETLFSPFGELRGAKLVLDRGTRKPRGFGFVTFVDDEGAVKALALNGFVHDGRPLTVRM
jgi:cold-inducible RNA-binding protein